MKKFFTAIFRFIAQTPIVISLVIMVVTGVFKIICPEKPWGDVLVAMVGLIVLVVAVRLFKKDKEDNRPEIEPVAANPSPPLYKEAYDLFSQGKLDETLALLDKDNLEDKRKGLATFYILKAQTLDLKNNFQDAEVNYRIAAAIFPSFENNFQVARFYYKQNNFPDAETYYTRCLPLAKTPVEKAIVLNNVGILHWNKKDYPKAAKAFEETLQIRRALATENPQAYLPYVAMILANLALFYLGGVPDRELSIQYAKEVLSYRRSSLEDIPDVRKSMEVAGQILNCWEKIPPSPEDQYSNMGKPIV
ncbi:MAG: tetratricopeptide repeat protein [Tannerellaceae bacterium]|jgi:tetratricopeptide (TPR) repeat protein|nr:tetratricopeptide repeat protein [Tannerellaceae bacterium]